MEENEIELESVVIESSVENPVSLSEKGNSCEEKVEKLVRFPMTRVKHLVKMDPDVHLCSQEAIFLITRATVLWTFSFFTLYLGLGNVLYS